MLAGPEKMFLMMPFFSITFWFLSGLFCCFKMSVWTPGSGKFSLALVLCFRYPRLSEEDIAECCPVCHGYCNCKACLRLTTIKHSEKNTKKVVLSNTFFNLFYWHAHSGFFFLSFKY